MDIQKQIEEALMLDNEISGYDKAIHREHIRTMSINWLNHQQSIILQQTEEIKRLKEIKQIAVTALKEVYKDYMRYIENEIEVDMAATRMDNTAEDALAEIKKMEDEYPC